MEKLKPMLWSVMKGYTKEQLVKDMTALGVERVGISNLLLPTTKEKNDLIYEAKCKYPKMIRAYMYVNFKDEDICEEIEKRMEDQHFDGFKIITAWDGVRADHFPKGIPRCFVLYNAVASGPKSKRIFDELTSRQKDSPNFSIKLLFSLSQLSRNVIIFKQQSLLSNRITSFDVSYRMCDYSDLVAYY